MIAEGLAVIGGDRDDGIAGESALLDGGYDDDASVSPLWRGRCNGANGFRTVILQ